MSFTAAAGGADPADEQVTVSNSGGGTLDGISVSAPTYQGSETGWLTGWNLDQTTATATITFSASVGALTAGTYHASVQVTSTASGVTNSPQQIDITFTVN